MVYVMFAPALTGSGESLSGTERSGSAASLTVVVSVAVLFAGSESVVVEAIGAVVMIVVPFCVVAFALTTRVKLALAPAAKVAIMAVAAPVPPIDRVVRMKVGPLSWVNETKVVLAGMVSPSRRSERRRARRCRA